MHEIPANVEQLLRAQGVTDAELAELRRTGRLERSDGATTVTIDINELSAPSMPAEELERLRSFMPVIPQAQRDQIELATGQDIDGDGRIAGGSVASPDPASAHAHVEQSTHGYSQSSAMPATSSGPFVGGAPRSGGGALVKLLVVLAIAGAVLHLVMR